MKEVLNSIVNLNELTQEYIKEFWSDHKAVSHYEDSDSKRVSNTSFFSEEEKKELESKITHANDEISALKTQISEFQSLVDSKNEEIKINISKQLSLAKSNSEIEAKLEKFKREVNNITESSEKEQKGLKLEVINYQSKEIGFQQEIEKLQNELVHLKSQIQSKDSMYECLSARFYSTRAKLESKIKQLEEKHEEVVSQAEFADLEKIDIKEELSLLRDQFSMTEDENRKLSERNHNLEEDVSDLSMEVKRLNDDNETLQESYDFNTK